MTSLWYAASLGATLLLLAAEPPAPTPVLHPDLAGLEPAVQDQLQEARAALEATAADGAARELSEAHGHLGRLYYAYQFLEAAESCFEHAAHWAPADARWTYYRASLRREAGDLPGAAELYERALEQRPGDLPSLVHLAEVRRQQGALDAAEALLLRALEVDEASPAARASLGEVVLARGQYRRAVGLLETVLEQVPRANRLHYPLAMAYRGLGAQDEARSHLAARGSVGLAVPDPLLDGLHHLREGERVNLLRGKRAFRAGDYEAAVDAFLAAVAAAPDSTRARVNLGSALAAAGKVDEAIEQYRMVLERSPADAVAHFNLGVLLVGRGDATGALVHLREAAEADPQDAEAHLELAGALRATGSATQALAQYARILRENERNEPARLGAAATLVALGRYRDAVASLESGHALEASSGRIAHALARLLAAAPDTSVRDGERALDLALRVFEARNSVPHAETVALALAELGRCDEAAVWQRQAMAALEGGERAAEAARLEPVAELYEAGPPCRPPSAVQP